MSDLEIYKLQSGAFKHVDSIDGEFFLGRFSFKNEFAKAFLVEAYGAKRREYVIANITVYDYLGTAETFTNFTDLINRLVALNYTGIDTNNILNFLSNDISTYSAVTPPIYATDLILINQGGTWKKVEAKDINIQSYKTISGNVTIDDTYHNCIVRVTANATITIPTGLRADWNAVFDVVGAFTATFVESSTTFSAPFGKKLLTDKMGSIYTTSTNNFRLNGGFSV